MILKDKIRSLIPLKYRIHIGPYVGYISYIWHLYAVKSHIKVLSPEDTLKIIQDKELSVVRFGDGEMSLIYGQDLGFQKYSKKLSSTLSTVLNSNEDKLLICIPGIWGNISAFSKRSFWFSIHHLFKYRSNWERLTNQHKIYGDAFITRPYIHYNNILRSEKIFELFKNIWHKKNIIILEGKLTRIGVGNDLLKNTSKIKRILCPQENAFEAYDKILEISLTMDKGDLFLVSLGPAAKPLILDLCIQGYRAIDIGHIDMEYEMFLRKSDKIVKVPYKYFNEINERGPEDCNDPEYLNQIIAEIN